MSERKYRHRGYMDSDRDANREGKKDRPAEKREPRPPADLPRPGRGMERAASEVSRCSSCGNTLDPGFHVAHDTNCPHCFSPLHCCRNCNFFDSSARFQCSRPIAAPIPVKTSANSCQEFQMRSVLDATGRRASTAGGPADPRKAFDALFKKR
jgi:hypothetical protein